MVSFFFYRWSFFAYDKWAIDFLLIPIGWKIVLKHTLHKHVFDNNMIMYNTIDAKKDICPNFYRKTTLYKLHFLVGKLKNYVAYPKYSQKFCIK